MQQKQNKKHRRNAGFTLIEIMVVVLIIGMLATLVGPNVMRALGKSNVTKCKADISALPQAVKMYKIDNRRFPDSLDILAEADDSGESYIEGNVRFVAIIANYCRNNFTDNEVKLFCKAVVNNK